MFLYFWRHYTECFFNKNTCLRQKKNLNSQISIKVLISLEKLRQVFVSDVFWFPFLIDF